MLEKTKIFLKQFFLIEDTPSKIAGGAALGVFLGIVPGEGVLSTLFFSYILRLNRLAALAGVAATNMWTTAAVLPIAAIVGGFIFRVSPETLKTEFSSAYASGWSKLFSLFIFSKVLLPLFVGFIITAGIISLIVYLVLFFSLKHKKISFK